MILALAVALAGGLGAAARFVVDGSVRSRWPTRLPVATLVVNLSGSALLGLVAGAALFHGLDDHWLAVAGTGLCGGYTTFSTATAETVALLQRRDLRDAVGYAIGSLVLCTAAAALGVALLGALR